MDWKMNERIDVDAGDETTDSEKKVIIFNLKRENDTIQYTYRVIYIEDY